MKNEDFFKTSSSSRPYVFSRDDIEKLRQKYPKGTVIKLIKMDDIQAPPKGTRGIVDHVDDAGVIRIRWDNGSSLGLIPEADEFCIAN